MSTTVMLMFTVKYGSDLQKIFNSNCQVINLLQHIATACGCKGEIDLAEESTGLLQFLRDFPYAYASTALKPRGSYVLVQCNKMDDHNYNYVPLWEPAAKTAGQPVKFLVKAQKQLAMRGKNKMEELSNVPSSKPVTETKTSMQGTQNKKQPTKHALAESTSTVIPATISPVTKPIATNSYPMTNNNNMTPISAVANAPASTTLKPTSTVSQTVPMNNPTNQNAIASPSKDGSPVKKVNTKVATKVAQ